METCTVFPQCGQANFAESCFRVIFRPIRAMGRVSGVPIKKAMMPSAEFSAEVSKMGLVIGLDAHTKACVYVVKDDGANVVDRGTLPATPADLAVLAERYPGATVVVESSGVTEWIYDRLIELGMAVFPAHPMNIRRIEGKKSDAVDAGFLVDAYRLGALRPSYVPPKEIRHLRQLARRCAFLTKERTRLKNRVHAILKRKGVRLMDDTVEDDVPDIFAAKHRERLLAVGDPEIPVLLDLIGAVTEKREDLDAELLVVADSNEDVRNLMTIPGFGPLAAVCVYAEVGDVSRFPSAESLCAYFGLVPAESQSGETRVRGHITRRGPPHVRWILNQASWQHVRRCPRGSIARAHKRTARRAGKKRAVTATSRRLTKVCHCLLRERRRFHDERPRGSLDSALRDEAA